MATMREEVYDKLHPLLEQLVDIVCGCIEELEECDQPELEQFNMERVLEQLEDYGKYKGILCIEKDGDCDNVIPVSIAKQIVKGRGLGGVLGYMEEGQ